MPVLMVQPFRDPQQRKALARLGLVNAGLVLLLVLLVSVLAADELANWKFVDGQLDPTSAGQNFPWDAIVAAAIAYLPILMVTWFAPQLVAWHGQPVGKALFFSFFACWRNRWPFLMLAAALFALSFGVIFIVTQLLQAFGASPQLASMLFAPVALVLVSVGYATQYPIYRSLIEKPRVKLRNMIRLELQVELNYEIDQYGADFVFNIHAAQTRSQVIAAEKLVLSQPIVPQMYTDPVTGNRYMRLRALPGH